MPPKLSAEERRQQILRAAVPLFAKHGFKGTTTKQIAKTARISEALLYRHFPSKESLYQELHFFCTAAKGLDEAMVTSLEPSTTTLVYAIHYLVTVIFDGDSLHDHNGFKHTDMNRMMILSFLEDGTFAKMFLAEKIKIWEVLFTDSIAAARECGDMVEDWIQPELSMWLGHHLAVTLALVNLPEETMIDYKTPHEQIVPQAVKFTLRGMGLKDEVIQKLYNPAAMDLFLKGIEKE